MKNRAWTLARRPTGLMTREDFDLLENDIDVEGLAEGSILVRNGVFLCAPTLRTWMTGETSNYHPSIPLGSPVLAPAAGVVIASRHPGYSVGTKVSGLSSWQDYVILNPNTSRVSKIPKEVTLVEAIGIFGINAQTAYFGLHAIGRAKPGETVVVSAAAGSVGSVAAQLAKRMGCTVIGIAGGDDKCCWLTTECGLDAAIDYKREDVSSALSALCPKGIDVYFDNVGGDILQAAVNCMARFGRIVLCGQIASYNDDAPIRGPENMMRIIYGGVTLRGFVISEFNNDVDRAVADLRAYYRAGLLAVRTDIRAGFDALPTALNDLFTGANKGTLLVTMDSAEPNILT